MRFLILVVVAFSVFACTSYPDLSDSRKVEVHYERGYKDLFQTYQNEIGPIHHESMKGGE